MNQLIYCYMPTFWVSWYDFHHTVLKWDWPTDTVPFWCAGATVRTYTAKWAMALGVRCPASPRASCARCVASASRSALTSRPTGKQHTRGWWMTVAPAVAVMAPRWRCLSLAPSWSVDLLRDQGPSLCGMWRCLMRYVPKVMLHIFSFLRSVSVIYSQLQK